MSMEPSIQRVGEEGPCRVCQQEADVRYCGDWEFRVNCKRCGLYFFEDGLDDAFGRLMDRHLFSGVLRELHETRREPTRITADSFDSLCTLAPSKYDVAAKARKLLHATARRSKAAGQEVRFDEDVDYPLAYASPDEFQAEFRYIAECLHSAGLVTKNRMTSQIRLTVTPAGWEELNRNPGVDSTKAFVAMWFNPSMDDAWREGISAALTECGYRPVRVDNEEFNGDVVDQIIAEIKESRFIVADLTGHRNGVYFEAGYAMGMGLQVIWTCHKDHGKETHFDAAHFNQIRWETPEQLQEKLINRIRATIGKAAVSGGHQ